ncbi:MAG TPA: twin-arginine translocase TatA/TatE family subunit [Gemmatimonadaceae bacterium]|nr:twin-arginine translocase TatA/TatE family subunit [Gemmatimonadaceae bacterium]
MGEIGIDKLLIILGVVVIFFGPRRLPELGATLGKGIRDFKRNLAGHDDPVVQAPVVRDTHDDAANAAPAEPKRLIP